MIRTGKDGRRWSERTLKDDRLAVADGLAMMPPRARELFEVLLSEADPGRADRLARELEEGLYHTPPVSMQQFLEDPYYLGESTTTLYPALRDVLTRMFEHPYREVLLAGSIGLDSLVQEADGALPTLGERLGRAGDVAVLLDSGQATSTTEPAHHSGIKEALRLTLANGMRVDLTPDHEVRVWRCEDGYCWVPASELVRGDLVVVPRTLRTAPSSNLGVDEAQLLAYWVADGSSSETRARFDDGNPRTSEEVLLLLERLGFHGKRYPIGKCCWEVSVSRVKRSGFLDWLRKYGADRKTADVIVPDAVCRAPDAVVAAFLNRLWACEGCVYAPPTACSPPRFALGMTSERFIRQVQMLLLRFGVRARIYHVPYVDRRSGAQREIWHLAVSGIDQLQKFVDRIGIILGKEEACARLVAYCETHRGNTNVDLIPMRGRELSMRMTAAGIARPTGTRWWSLASMVRGRMSRQLFEEWAAEFGGTELGQELVRAFPVDLAFEPVTSVEPLALAIPVGDVGAHNGNRFLANGINVHNSIGYGKTYLLSIAICRVLYEMSCLRDIQATFGVGPGTDMVLMLVSKSLPLCREVMKTAVDDKVKLSPYFMGKFPPKFSTDFTLFPNNVRVSIGSYGAERALGKALVMAALDETNFPPKRNAQQIQQTLGKQLTAAHFDIVEKVYRSLVRRIKSRFERVSGDVPGMVLLASSAATLDSFTERKIRESLTDPDVFVVEHSQWSARPPEFFSGKVFHVLCSKSSLRTRILDTGEIEGIDDAWLAEHEAWVVEVPEEFRDDFESNLEDSLRDIAGVSTQAISAFFQRVEAIDACIVERPHPFSDHVWVAGSPGNFDWKLLCRKVERRLPGGYTEDAWLPREAPSAPRWIHIDVSTNRDYTGFCVTADTLVATPSGNRRIDSIASGTPVYSLGEDGNFRVATATDPGLRRVDAKIVRVVTDGGSVRCTPEHRFMLRDGTYREAQDLRAGDSLMPLYRRLSPSVGKRRGGGGYEEFYQPKTGRHVPAHRLVAEFKIGRSLTVDECVHHIGVENPNNKLDNRPENLDVMQKRAHWRLHVEYSGSDNHRKWFGDMVRARHSSGLCQKNYENFVRPDIREKTSRAVSIANRKRAWDEEDRKKLSEGRRRYEERIRSGEEVRKPVSEETRVKMAAAHRGKTWSAETRAKQKASRKPQVWTEEMRSKIAEANRRRVWTEEGRRNCSEGQRWRHRHDDGKVKNHKVLRVEDAGSEDVYCLNVADTHNFVVVFDDGCLSSGVVIHNCMGRIDRWVEVVRRDGDGNRYTDTAPYYIIEVLLSIRPPTGEQIYMPDLRRLVYELQAHGYPIAGFSTDKYEHVEMHQQIGRKGIHTELISMDTTMDPYEELKSAIYERRIEYYHHEQLLQELRALECDRVKGKVDHPYHKTKDLADACAGAIWGLRQRAARLPWAADADTPKGVIGHEHQWVSPLIPAEEVDRDEVRAAQRAREAPDRLPAILFGDED